jgi:hypothetical protein
MIKRKEKYETPQFIFWLTEYGRDSHYEYDIILSSKNVAPSVTKTELKNLASFINQFLNSEKQ